MSRKLNSLPKMLVRKRDWVKRILKINLWILWNVWQSKNVLINYRYNLVDQIEIVYCTHTSQFIRLQVFLRPPPCQRNTFIDNVRCVDNLLQFTMFMNIAIRFQPVGFVNLPNEQRKLCIMRSISPKMFRLLLIRVQ